jgi:hypothetical protein
MGKWEKAKKEMQVIAKQYGFRIVIRRQAEPVINPEDSIYEKPSIRGYYSVSRKEATVVVPWNAGRRPRHLISIMAHEVRHAMHHALGLYRDYYRAEHKVALTIFNKTRQVPTWYTPPNLGVGMRAELDCDDWARKFLKKHGIRDKKITSVRYNLMMVMGYFAVKSISNPEGYGKVQNHSNYQR